MICKLEDQKLKISLGNRVYRIQHTRIMLERSGYCHFCFPGCKVIGENWKFGGDFDMQIRRSKTKNFAWEPVLSDSAYPNYAKKSGYCHFYFPGCKVMEKIGNLVAILICKLDGQKVKISLGNRFYRIQHTRIMLKSLLNYFYLKMHQSSYRRPFSRNGTRLYIL